VTDTSAMTTPGMRCILSVITAAVLGAGVCPAAGADQWRSLGPDVKGDRQVVIDPVTPSNLYMATQSGEFKSADSGLTWKWLLNGLPSENVVSLSLSASTRAGRFAGPSTAYALVGTTIYRSSDGGESWNQAAQLPRIERLVADPSDARTLYAVNRVPLGISVFEIDKSVDGGTTWVPTGSSSIPVRCPEGLCDRDLRNLLLDAARPGVLYAWSYRSVDGGQTWHPIGRVDAVNHDAHYRFGTGSTIETSTDGGATWTLFAAGATFGLESAQEVFASPHDDVVYVRTSTTRALYHTTNRGRTWNSAPTPASGPIALDPMTPSTLYIGNAWKSIDYGMTWSPLPATGMRDRPSVEVTSVTVAPSRPETIYAVSSFASTFSICMSPTTPV
jgi:hypothetical protein